MSVFFDKVAQRLDKLDSADRRRQFRQLADEIGFFESVFFSFSAAVGFGFALVIFSGIREKLAYADPPRCFRGMAIALVTGGLLSLAFMGFSGLVKLPY